VAEPAVAAARRIAVVFMTTKRNEKLFKRSSLGGMEMEME
jgi:hypothetical protein